MGQPQRSYRVRQAMPIKAQPDDGLTRVELDSIEAGLLGVLGRLSEQLDTLLGVGHGGRSNVAGLSGEETELSTSGGDVCLDETQVGRDAFGISSAD